MCTLEKERTYSKDNLCSSNMKIGISYTTVNFIIPFGNKLLAASVVLDFSTEYHNSRQNGIILFWKYLVDIISEAWLNLFCEYINGKLFAVWKAENF
jgi:hypothetical protein